MRSLAWDNKGSWSCSLLPVRLDCTVEQLPSPTLARLGETVTSEPSLVHPTCQDAFCYYMLRPLLGSLQQDDGYSTNGLSSFQSERSSLVSRHQPPCPGQCPGPGLHDNCQRVLGARL
jgi:hypothetical protein